MTKHEHVPVGIRLVQFVMSDRNIVNDRIGAASDIQLSRSGDGHVLEEG